MNMLPLLLYIVAAVAYACFFARRSRKIGRLATASLAGAALVHTFVIGMRTVEVGQLPFVGTAAAISASPWMVSTQSRSPVSIRYSSSRLSSFR